MAIWRASPNMYYGRRTDLKWIVWHSTESSEVRGGAYNIAVNWFGTKKSRVSAHIVVDDGADPRYPDGVVECVKPQDTAWHAAKANAGGYGIEIIGKAGQNTGQWNDPYSLAAIKNACLWVSSNRRLQHIPARWLTDQQLRTGEYGHIVHSQVSRVLGGTNHTDPGPAFPFEYVMQQLDGSAVDPGPSPIARTFRVEDPLLQGDDVKSLQQALNRTFPSYSQIAEDGFYGPATAAVVKEFQRRTGITADGIVGPQTRVVLARFGI